MLVPISNTYMRFLFLIVLSIFLFSSCKSSKDATKAGSSQERVLLISMKKTACYGTCPVYELQIYSDLAVNLKGEMHLDKIGIFEAKISRGRLEQIQTMFREADFFSFQDKYSEKITDLPTTYVYFNDSGQEKKVMDYYGAPEALKNLEKELSSFLEELDWKERKD